MDIDKVMHLNKCKVTASGFSTLPRNVQSILSTSVVVAAIPAAK